MNLLRSLLYLSGQIISAILISALALLSYVLPRSWRDPIIGSWAKLNMWTLRKICGVSYRVHGEENIPQGPAIILSNHQSAWETLFFQLLFPPLSFILKRQLLWIPFFGWGLAAYRPIAIDRSRKVKALDQLITQGRARLDEGRWLVIYPEGTRMPPGEPGKFQIGGAMIAAKTGAPVVPVAHNAGLFWPKNGLVKNPGTVDIIVGPTIDTTGKKAREINEEAERWIIEALQTLPSE